MAGQVTRARFGFTLVELLVVIAIIGTLMALLLPAVQNARESGRANACRANLTQLQKAMSAYEVADKSYPGYVNPIGTIVKKTKASWAAMLLPYLERQDLWEKYFRGEHAVASIEFFVCPSNPPPADDLPGMSYLANAGSLQDERIEAESDECNLAENPANGVFTDRFRMPCDPTPPPELLDVRDLDPDCRRCAHDPVLKITFAHIQSQGDGSTHTLMFAEGLNALHWALLGGDIADKKWHFGFCWEQPQNVAQAQANSASGANVEGGGEYRVINGVRETIWKEHVGLKGPNSAFPSSHHPGGVNVAFVGGQVQHLSEKIDPVVYAQLMTSNRKQSDLVVGSQRDRDLTTPDADDY
jgi:prepilin-type N-terminal cleavage/methylation domain-containing protein/prepilin-type processing-associated H-X9-DG protein